MVKFSHSIFALPFALMATFLAARAAWRAGDAPRPYPSATQLLLIVACMVSARSVAMTFNRIIDARLDAANPRTAGRALPAGAIRGRQAWAFLFVGAVVFLAACGGFWWFEGNAVPMALGLPVLGYLCFYSYTKRFTTASHFVLGSAIAFSPVGAWLAIHPASIGWAAVVLMGSVATWIAGFDIIYACQDVEFDRREGLFSLPARLGVGPALWIARLSHAGTVAMLIALAWLEPLGYLYGAGVGAVALLLVVENALVRRDDLSRVNLAFFTVNGVISVVLGVLTIIDCVLTARPPGT
jgi:4-hydroxybenzoate polyprenyltransferase